MFRKNSASTNPILLVLVAVLAGAALPYLGAVTTGTILSIAFVAYGALVLQRGQRVIGALFIIAAIGIVGALLLRQ